jgi:hypothetical protein
MGDTDMWIPPTLLPTFNLNKTPLFSLGAYSDWLQQHPLNKLAGLIDSENTNLENDVKTRRYSVRTKADL